MHGERRDATPGAIGELGRSRAAQARRLNARSSQSAPHLVSLLTSTLIRIMHLAQRFGAALCHVTEMQLTAAP